MDAKPPSPRDFNGGHVTIIDECRSSPMDEGSLVIKETGHERLLHKTPSTDGKSISHCRASPPPHYLYFALLVAIFCNCPFGGLAVIFSILSKKSSEERNFQTARARGDIAKWLSIIGIAISTVVIAFLIVYYVYIDKNIIDTENEFRGV